MVKYLNFHNSSFALIYFLLRMARPVWQTPCLIGWLCIMQRSVRCSLFNWLIVYYAVVIWGVVCLISWLIVYYAAVSCSIICLIGWLIVYYAVVSLWYSLFNQLIVYYATSKQTCSSCSAYRHKQTMTLLSITQGQINNLQ
jgi:hypothetical protein